MRVADGRCSALFWRRCDKLRISGFVDDVMLSHNVIGLMVRYVYS